MSETRGLRLTPSAAVKEKRLAGLLAGRGEAEPGLVDDVRDAQLLGSLELAGFRFDWKQVKTSRRDASGVEPIVRLRAAQAAVAPGAPFSLDALAAWHAAATDVAVGFRGGERERLPGPPCAPAAFVRGRLELLEQWLNADSGRELSASQAGALTLARLVEIAPFDDANGRVARLAASHVMVRAGARPPILAGGDRPRLEACLVAAFQLQTEPLTALLEEAAGRAVDVMIAALEREGGRRP